MFRRNALDGGVTDPPSDMAITQDVFVIGEGLSERRRTTSSGTKSRFTIDVKTEPLIINLSEVALGQGPAEALRKAISDGIKSISAVASPGTLLKRKYAASAFARGAPAAVKRYSGGKTGSTPPAQSDRLFNDSGRLANGVFVRQNPKEGSWIVNVPANRLDPSTFKDMSQFTGMVQRLRELVPALQNPLQSPAVRTAINASLDQMITKATEQNYKLKMETIKAALNLIKTAFNVVDSALGG